MLGLCHFCGFRLYYHTTHNNPARGAFALTICFSPWAYIPFANMTSTQTNTAAGMINVPCAVIYAGTALLLAIPQRAGRFPVQVTSIDEPLLAWTCADGAQECVMFDNSVGPDDHTAVIAQVLTDGLLAAEVDDISSSDLSKAAHYLIEYAPAIAEKERVR